MFVRLRPSIFCASCNWAVPHITMEVREKVSVMACLNVDCPDFEKEFEEPVVLHEVKPIE